MEVLINNSRLTRIAITVVCFQAVSYSNQTIYDTIRKAFPEASPIIIVLFGSCLIFVLGFIVAWEIFKTDRQKREKSEVSWQNFSEQVLQKGLNLEETKVLKNMIFGRKQIEADTIFQVANIYETSLEGYLDTFRKSNNEISIPYDTLTTLRKKLGFSMLPVETPLTSTKQLNSGLNVLFSTGKSTPPISAKISDITEKCWSLHVTDAVIDLEAGKSINISFIRGGDAEYKLDSEIIEWDSGILILKHTNDLSRNQLRNWVRVDVNIPCRIVVTTTPSKNQKQASKEESIAKGSSLNGRIVDISGGGICLRLNRGISSGVVLSLNFDLPGSSLNNVKSEIISYNLQKNTQDVYIHRLKFNEIETALQEKIVRFVFEKNRIDSQFRQN